MYWEFPQDIKEKVKPASHMQFSPKDPFDHSPAFYRVGKLVPRPASLLLLLPGGRPARHARLRSLGHKVTSSLIMPAH
jgi:hypothetical protein